MKYVYFFELSGEGAREELEHLQEKLEHFSFVHSTKLLKNSKQEDLFLLVVEASEEPHIKTPQGIRVWTFTEVASSQ
jgi:hypothetical protein